MKTVFARVGRSRLLCINVMLIHHIEFLFIILIFAKPEHMVGTFTLHSLVLNHDKRMVQHVVVNKVDAERALHRCAVAICDVEALSAGFIKGNGSDDVCRPANQPVKNFRVMLNHPIFVGQSG
jgi:hypothetical protein